MGFPGDSDGKESACNAGDLGSISESGDSLEEDMATYSSILAWKIPWAEELYSPCGHKELGIKQEGSIWYFLTL